MERYVNFVSSQCFVEISVVGVICGKVSHPYVIAIYEGEMRVHD